MSFLFNRGAIVFITSSIISLIPIAISTFFIIFTKTFPNFESLSVFLHGGIWVLYLTPLFIFLMGDALFYFKFVKHQEVSPIVKAQSVAAFFLMFTIYYVAYFLSIDAAAGFIDLIM
jgi:hypothetical protein